LLSKGTPFDSDSPARPPGVRSIGKDRIYEILVLVNTLEKPSPPKFSISFTYLLCRVPDYAE
jgi:hypothetical protein